MRPPPFLRLALLAGALAVSGCSSTRPSTPAPWAASAAPACIALNPSLPSDHLPSDVVAFSGGGYLLVPAESALSGTVDLLVPLPFVTEAISSAAERAAAAKYEAQLASAQPFQAARKALDPKRFAETCPGKGPTLSPFVFIVEGYDERYRLTLVYQLQGDGWVGRYQEHLPTTIPKADLEALPPELLKSVRRDLEDGALLLADLMDRDLRGELASEGVKVEAGSLYLVGGKLMGFMAPEKLKFKDVDLITENGDDLVLRMRGDPANFSQVMGLLFGVHHFRRSQLFHFERQP